MKLDPEQWEQRMKRELDACLLHPTNPEINPSDLMVEEVLVERSYPETEVAVLFRVKSRPECLFGYRWGRFWAEIETGGRGEEPESYAHVIWANLIERLEAADSPPLPEDCDAKEVTWISR